MKVICSWSDYNLIEFIVAGCTGVNLWLPEVVMPVFRVRVCRHELRKRTKTNLVLIIKVQAILKLDCKENFKKKLNSFFADPCLERIL